MVLEPLMIGGDGPIDRTAPVLDIALSAKWCATTFHPILVTGSVKLNAPCFDLSVNDAPSFYDYRSTDLTLKHLAIDAKLKSKYGGRALCPLTSSG